MRRPRPLDVAIVGMACRFPGSPDLFAFWENILAGRDCLSDIPPDRWDADVFCDPSSPGNDRVSGRRGGYLDFPIPIDPAAHGVLPQSLDGGEPEQHLILDAARSALADASLPDGVPDGRRVEVVIGRGNYFNRGNLTRLQHGRITEQTVAVARALRPDLSETELTALRADLKAGLPPFDASTIPGQLTNATAGRVANRLDLRGASFVVDAASASSLVALDLGARSLADGRADLAIVGGVYVQSDVDFPLVFSRLGALSRSGRSRPFGADAEGMVPGEGVGVVVLKRRDDAERDGDRVYATLRGVGIASDGRGLGLASPNARGHALAMRRAYRRSGLDPASVGLIEGHGLGVPAADRAELRAIRAVFPPSDDRGIGAVSSQIGHAMPASGIAGLIKAALALHHRALPPTLGANDPHPLLREDRSDDAPHDHGREPVVRTGAASNLGREPDLPGELVGLTPEAGGPIGPVRTTGSRPWSRERRTGREGPPATLNRTTRPWVHGRPETPRRAAVNAFGFAGINAHAVLEEHRASADGPGCLPRWESEAILLGAADRGALGRSMERLADRVERRPDVSLKDLASTLNADVEPGAARLGLVVSSTGELVERLRSLAPRLAAPSCRAIKDGRGLYFREEAAPPPPLAVIFPGEGSQFPGMLGDLALHFPSVLALLDTSDRLAREGGATELPSRLLYGESATDDRRLWGIGPAVNVVLSAQWALYGLLRSLDIRPSAVVGHSSGELLALAAAGSVRVDRPFEDALGRLGGLFERMEASGDVPEATLLAVAAGRERLEPFLRDRPVMVAMDNCPHQVVLAGDREAMAQLKNVLSGEGLLSESLPFSRAYHTPAFASAAGPVRRLLDGLEMASPSVPIYSCASAGPMPSDPVGIRDLAAEQWSRPVRFREAIERMFADGYRTFIDVGPRGHLAGFVEDTLRGREASALAMGLPRRSGVSQLNHLVAALHSLGYAPKTDELYARRRPIRVNLDAPPPPADTRPTLRLGFPEMRVSPALAERLAPSVERESGGGNGDWLRVREVPVPFSSGAGRAPERGETAAVIAPATGKGGQAPRSTSEPVPFPSPNDDGESTDDVMVDYFRTMDHFLDAQREVMSSYLRPVEADITFDPPGPWAGEIQEIEEGHRVVTLYRLDAEGDPMARQHTLGGRRVSALDPDRLGLPVLPFAEMAEMLAQVAAILAPGEVLASLRDVRAHRWIRYEDGPVGLEMEARRVEERPEEIRVAIYNRGPIDALRPREAPVVEGVAVFADRRPEPIAASPFRLPDAGRSRFTAESLYGEQWLFHGPALQAVTVVGETSLSGASGRLRILPRGPLLREPGDAPSLHTDPIILDNFTHLLGAWGLDRLDGGDVVFPLRMGELSLFGEAPEDGSEVDCRILIRGLEHHRVLVESEIVRDDGTVWMRISNWEDWRFHWPGRYRDVFRRPDAELLGEELSLGDVDPSTARAVWLQPPADMGRSVWRDVLEQTQLSPDELAEVVREPDSRRALRLWERVAAKDAARRLGLDRGDGPAFPADLEIRRDADGRTTAHSLLATHDQEARIGGFSGGSDFSRTRISNDVRLKSDPPETNLSKASQQVPIAPGRDNLPAVAFASAEGVAVALASRGTSDRPGIAVEKIGAHSAGFEAALLPSERRLLDLASRGGERSDWAARFGCARRAVAESLGVEPGSVAVVGLGPGAEGLIVEAGGRGEPIRVSAGRRDEYVWAWTLGERSEHA